tara:strand:- start:263 stop:508 length:246 start_codon:yes stop_codon:yes gene_type:complete
MKRKEAIIGATLVAIVVAGFYGKSEVDERDDTIQRREEAYKQLERDSAIKNQYTHNFIKSIEDQYNINQLYNSYIDGLSTL